MPSTLNPHFAQMKPSAGFGCPQFVQKFPVFTVPQLHVQPAAGCGFGCPQLVQNLPVFSVPQLHFHAGAEAAAAAGAAVVAAAAAALFFPAISKRL